MGPLHSFLTYGLKMQFNKIIESRIRSTLTSDVTQIDAFLPTFIDHTIDDVPINIDDPSTNVAEKNPSGYVPDQTLFRMSLLGLIKKILEMFLTLVLVQMILLQV